VSPTHSCRHACSAAACSDLHHNSAKHQAVHPPAHPSTHSPPAHPTDHPAPTHLCVVSRLPGAQDVESCIALWLTALRAGAVRLLAQLAGKLEARAVHLRYNGQDGAVRFEFSCARRDRMLASPAAVNKHQQRQESCAGVDATAATSPALHKPRASPHWLAPFAGHPLSPAGAGAASPSPTLSLAATARSRGVPTGRRLCA
jgi:hypothetical protein